MINAFKFKEDHEILWIEDKLILKVVIREDKTTAILTLSVYFCFQHAAYNFVTRV